MIYRVVILNVTSPRKL